ncbi:MAG: CopD family protein [Magnetospiraceae bacterium]
MMPSFGLLMYPVHILAATLWVGGLFFAYIVLRPSVMLLEPPHRIGLWNAVFARFFLWVWISIAALFISGILILVWYFGGMVGAPLHIHLMLGLALIMTALYAYVFFVPYPAFKKHAAAANWPAAAAQQARIRTIVGINLLLGIATIVVGASGRLIV